MGEVTVIIETMFNMDQLMFKAVAFFFVLMQISIISSDRYKNYCAEMLS